MLSLTLNITKNVVEWVFGILSSASCGPNWSDEAASTAADDDLIRVETCTDPCGPNRSDEAASTAADDDLIKKNPNTLWNFVVN